MNRIDEYKELREEMEKIPFELAYSGTKAISRVKSYKRRRMIWRTPIIALFSLSLIFVLVVNISPSAAFAMSKIPIVKELVQFVSFDESLKRAVENDYYQVVGKNQTKDDVTATIEYIIVDGGHLSIFFRVDAPVKKGFFRVDLTDSSGTELPLPMVCQDTYETGKMNEIQVELWQENYTLPSDIELKLIVNKNKKFNENGRNTMKSEGVNETFYFPLHMKKQFLVTKDIKPINEWIEINGQRILLDRIEIYPSRARLFLQYDKDNKAAVHGLDIHLKDNKGKVYSTAGGLSSQSSDDQNIITMDFESSYFTNAKQLTLYIDGVSLIDKSKRYGEIDPKNKLITNLPKGVSIKSMTKDGKDLNIILNYKVGYKKSYSLTVMMTYEDENGKSYEMKNCGVSTLQDQQEAEVRFTILNDKNHKYRLEWAYAPMEKLHNPVKVLLQK